MKSTQYEFPTVLSRDSLVPLESVLCTEELNRRTTRPPDYEAENRALVSLVQELAESPRTILQTLADKILEVFDAGSAGVSLLTKEDGGKRFYWPAIAGVWKPHIGGGTPRDFGPCGDVLDRNAPLMFRHLERRYTYFLKVTPPVEECLLVPFYAEGQAVGTIWAIFHDDRRQFDAEDLRQLVSLGRFASSAYQAVTSLNAFEQQGEELRQNHAALAQTLADLQKTNLTVRDSHRAALNLMEQSRHAMERLNVESRASEERFREMIDALPAAIYTTDAEGRVTHFNPAAVELSGRTPVLGEDMWCVGGKLYHPDGTPMPYDECPMAVALREGRVVHGTEVVLERPDGTRVWVTPFATPLRDAEGKIRGGVNMLVDITERKHFEAERERLLAQQRRDREFLARLIECSPVAIAVVRGMEFEYTLANPAYQAITGWDEPIIGHTLVEVFPEGARPAAQSLRNLIRTRQPYRIQDFRLIRHTIETWWEGEAFPLSNEAGEVDSALILTWDITDRKRAEEVLKESDRRKNEFMAMLAHELRNPLAPLRNSLEILRLGEGNSQAVQSAAAMMDRQIVQMVRLVDDLLDVSRISRGKIELRKGFIDLASSLNQAVEAARPLCESKGLTLTVTLPQPPLFLNADPIRLAQVVGNLLSNACKFTDKGGRIWLTAEVVADGEGPMPTYPKEGHGEGCTPFVGTQASDTELQALKLATSHAVIRVRDSGIGLAADQLPRIFEMFMQVDTSLERTRNGLGIGLTLAKNIVELHGGTIQVHSAGEGQGSEFVVRLPIMVEAPQSLPPEPTISEPKNTPSRRILVVDDNEDSAESLTILLSLAGNETQTAFDGLEAMESAATFKPELILLDIGLPKLNGYEVARKIREQPWGKKMVLVALTGWGQEEDRCRSREAGFDHHLTKPIDLGSLKKLLTSLSMAKAAG